MQCQWLCERGQLCPTLPGAGLRASFCSLPVQLHLYLRAQRLKCFLRSPSWADGNVSLQRNLPWLCPTGATGEGRPGGCTAWVERNWWATQKGIPCPRPRMGHRHLTYSGIQAREGGDVETMGPRPKGVRIMPASKFKAPLRDDSTSPPSQAPVT